MTSGTWLNVIIDKFVLNSLVRTLFSMMDEILAQGAHAVLFVLLSATFYTYLLYPAYISPLSKIPSAHPLSVITPFWIIWVRFHNREIKIVDAAHKKFGSVVRLGPNEVSVNCIDGGIRTVHGGGFEKPKWYSFFVKYG